MKKWIISVVCASLLCGCSLGSTVKEEKVYRPTYASLHELSFDESTKGLISKNKAETKAYIQKEKQHVQITTPKASDYLQVASDYSGHLNEVFATISKDDDAAQLEKKYHQVIKEIAIYEAKKDKVTVSEKQKDINANIDKANEKYIDSISKITTGVTENNETLKEVGFKEAAEGHVYFQKATLYMSKLQPSSVSDSSEASHESETPVIKEVYTTESTETNTIPTSAP